MKWSILILTITLCNGCFTSLVAHQYSQQSGTYPLTKMTVLEGGLTDKNNFIINRMSDKENSMFLIGDRILSQVQITRQEDEFIMTDVVTESISKKIPIYSRKQSASKDHEYLKIISCENGVLQLEYNDCQNKTHRIDVDAEYSKDPYLFKRSGLILVFPVALSIDLGLTMFAAMGRASYPDAFEAFKERKKSE